MWGFPEALWGRLLLGRRSKSPSAGDRGRQADAIAPFWAQKLAENRHILDLIEAGTFTVGGRPVLDAETLGARSGNGPPSGWRRVKPASPHETSTTERGRDLHREAQVARSS